MRSFGGMAAPPSASSRMMGVPCETRSPGPTSSSVTVPACGAGMSMVALSDSSVISGSSTATLAPGRTCTSMMGTSLKSPISGTLISTLIACPLPASEHQSPDILEQGAELSRESRRQRPVDDAVVVGEEERQHQPRPEGVGLRIPDRRGLRAHHAEDRHLRRIDDRGEGSAADAAEGGDGEGAALHVGCRELAVARLLRQRAQLVAQLDDAL